MAAWRRARRLLAYPRCKRQALAALLARHRGQRLLVFVPDNETAYAIAREHLIMPFTCDIGRAERMDVLDRFRAGGLRALVSAQVLNEGLDVPDAEVGIVVGGRFGEREHLQRVGRVLRPHDGKRAVVYELVVADTSDVAQARRRGQRLAARGRAAAQGDRLGSRPLTAAGAPGPLASLVVESAIVESAIDHQRDHSGAGLPLRPITCARPGETARV